MPLFFIFTTVSLLEIFVLIEVGGVLGAGMTVLIILFTALTGSIFVRKQGLVVLRNLQNDLEQGRLPETALLEGLILIISGVLLVTPGFVTDITGLLMLIPAIRIAVSKLILLKIKSGAFKSTGFSSSQFGSSAFGFHSQQKTRKSLDDDNAIEAEFERHDEPK